MERGVRQSIMMRKCFTIYSVHTIFQGNILIVLSIDTKNILEKLEAKSKKQKNIQNDEKYKKMSLYLHMN